MGCINQSAGTSVRHVVVMLRCSTLSESTRPCGSKCIDMTLRITIIVNANSEHTIVHFQSYHIFSKGSFQFECCSQRCGVSMSSPVEKEKTSTTVTEGDSDFCDDDFILRAKILAAFWNLGVTLADDQDGQDLNKDSVTGSREPAAFVPEAVSSSAAGLCPASSSTDRGPAHGGDVPGESQTGAAHASGSTSWPSAPSMSKREQEKMQKGFKRKRGGSNSEYFTYWSKTRRANWSS